MLEVILSHLGMKGCDLFLNGNIHVQCGVIKILFLIDFTHPLRDENQAWIKIGRHFGSLDNSGEGKKPERQNLYIF